MKQILCTILFLCAGYMMAAQPDVAPRTIGISGVIPASYLNKLCLDAIVRRRLADAGMLADSALKAARIAGDREEEAIALMNIGNIYSLQGNGRGALLQFVRSLKLKTIFRNKAVKERLYYRTAITLARMRQYPHALKFFHKAAYEHESAATKQDPDTCKYSGLYTDSIASSLMMDEMMDIADSSQIIIDHDTLLLGAEYDNSRSLPVKPQEITRPFRDQKNALAYGIMLHVKQAATGKRKPFAGINTVGHMFITLVKFNADGSYVSRTFGFYPAKDNILSATPLFPGTSSVFKDDQYHSWDELAGKFVSKHKFNRILRMVRRYSKKKYNLNHNNCTDFGLCIAAIAGISIKDTKGSWPLGGGNNPGATGQSMLEGKVNDAEQEALFLLPYNENLDMQGP